MISLTERVKALRVQSISAKSSVEIIVGIGILCLLLLVISWMISLVSENSGLKRRHICCIVSFAGSCATLVLAIVSTRVEPMSLILYGLQLLCVVSLALTAISTGMNTLVVDICIKKEVTVSGVHCGAHYMELASGLLVCLLLAVLFLSVQQKIVELVDKGILKGLGSRLSRL